MTVHQLDFATGASNLTSPHAPPLSSGASWKPNFSRAPWNSATLRTSKGWMVVNNLLMEKPWQITG